MNDQVAFFNNVNQIVFDYYSSNNNEYINNYIKDSYFDRLNNTKSIVLNYTDYVNNVNNFNNLNNLNIELNNFEEYIIIVDVLTFNKLNVMKFNNY